MGAGRVVGLVAALALAGCAMHGPSSPHTGVDDKTGADIANVWYSPGRAITCGGAAVVAGIVMTMTLGNANEMASEIMHGACSGPWTLNESDMHRPVP